MSKFIGRQFNIGLGIETGATRGIPTTVAYWIPKQDITFDNEPKQAIDDSSIAVNEDASFVDTVSTTSKGNISGLIYDLFIGVLLKSVFGTDTFATLTAGAYTHKFTVAQNNQHSTMTLSTASPNENAGSGAVIYPLAAVDSLQLNFAVGKYSTYKADILANTSQTTSTATVSFVSANRFRPQDMSVTFATTFSGLPGTTFAVKNAQITMKNNSMLDIVLGSLTPVDNLNQEMSIEGQFECLYVDRSWIDTYLVPSTPVALEFLAINTQTALASTYYPTINIRLAKCFLSSVARKIDNKNIISETIKFKAVYSLGDTESMDITLTNSRAGAY